MGDHPLQFIPIYKMLFKRSFIHPFLQSYRIIILHTNHFFYFCCCDYLVLSTTSSNTLSDSVWGSNSNNYNTPPKRKLANNIWRYSSDELNYYSLDWYNKYPNECTSYVTLQKEKCANSTRFSIQMEIHLGNHNTADHRILWGSPPVSMPHKEIYEALN